MSAVLSRHKAHLDLTFLGTFEALVEGEPITRYQCLLSYLALNSGRRIPREVLAAMFWPDEPDSAARHNLRQALYELRQALGDDQIRSEPYLLAAHRAVAFNAHRGASLDVAEFLAAIEAHDLEAAVNLYGGDLLPGFTCDSLQFEEWLRQERESLHQLALEAMSELAQERLDAGDLDKAQSAIRRQLALEPWREIAFRQLMQAYAKAGDRVNALATYEKCAAVLAEELGIAPSPETVALYEDIEAGRFSTIRGAGLLKPPRVFKHNLPAETTPLIGRELELAAIAQLLNRDQRRLVTISGPGGIGKTRLALAAGARLLPHFTDGVYFVDLAPLAEPTEIMPAIAAALDYQPPDKAQPLQPQLLEHLSQRQLLLILDNFEHLLEGAGPVDDILRSCPRVSLLVTTRQLLNLASESRYELGGLEYPSPLPTVDALAYEAVQLFVERAVHVQPSFALGMENVIDVVHICELVQGMPLALMLAAAWLGLLSPAEIAAEIEQNLDFLSADLADLPARQRSMEAVFDGTWQMMTPAEQEVLAKLSVFRGGFTREAAAQVAGANLRILLSLMSKSLLQRQARGNRFTMHELMRQYVAQKRRLGDPDDLAALKFCRYFGGLTKREVQYARYWLPFHMPQKHAAEWDNLRRAWDFALQQGLAAELADLVGGMSMFSMARGIPPGALIRQAIQMLEQHSYPEIDRSILFLRLLEMEDFAFTTDHEVRVDRLQAFIPVVEAYGDLELIFWAYDSLADLYYTLGNSEEALARASEARQVAVDMGEDSFIRLSEATELWYRTEFGEYDQLLRKRLQELRRLYEPDIPDIIVCYMILRSLGEQCRAAMTYVEALEHYNRALNIAKRWQDLGWISIASNGLTNIYVQMGLLVDAGQSLLDLLDWHLAVGQKWQTLGCLYGMSKNFRQEIIGLETAVSILSLVYHHTESNPLDKRVIENLRPQLENELDQEVFTAAWERGKTLDFETAVAQMRVSLQTLK